MENNNVGEEKSKILVIGGTGRIGRHIVKASVNAGHQTFVLVRPSTIANDHDNERSKLIATYITDGVTILHGDVYDADSLLRAVRQVDVVISAMGHGSKEELADQINIVAAIKEAGNVKRFIPSEFGCDVEQVKFLEPANGIVASKVKLRQIIRDECIPYTFICNYLFHGFFLPNLGNPEVTTTPTDKVYIFGNGDAKAIFVNENDIATYTIKTLDDPRTLNKILYLRPPNNFYSLNELVALWEQITGKNLDKIYIPEHVLLNKIQDSPFPLNFQFAIAHSSFVNGDHAKEKVDDKIGIEGTNLYPEIKYKTVAEFMTEMRE